MKGKTKLTILICVSIISSVAFIQGCKNLGASSEMSFSQNDYMSAYLRSQAADRKPWLSSYNAFFDLSDGINPAYDSHDIRECLSDVVKKLKDTRTDFYSLSNGEIMPLEGNTEWILNTIFTPSSSFHKMKAPLRKALAKIVESRRPALLVTDFEEYDGNVIHDSAYARPFFTEWLTDAPGNSITFFIFDYNDQGRPRKLYFTVFNLRNKKLLGAITAALAASPQHSYTTFTLSNNQIGIKRNYPSTCQGGGFHDKEGVDGVTFFMENTSSDPHFFLDKVAHSEFYPMVGPESYAEILENASNEVYHNPTHPYPPYSFTHIWRNLFIDTSNLPYKNIEFDVKAYIMDGDLEKYNRYLEAVYNKPTTRGASNKYYFEDGTMRPEYIYHPANTADLPQVTDMFVLDPYPRINPTNVPKIPGREIAIAFSPNFTGKIQGGPDCNDYSLIRVDVVYKRADIPSKDDLDLLFKWGENDCLSESILLTLDDINPTGSTVYSYYLKLY